MPSDQNMAKWAKTPKKAPKHVRESLLAPFRGSSGKRAPSAPARGTLAPAGTGQSKAAQAIAEMVAMPKAPEVSAYKGPGDRGTDSLFTGRLADRDKDAKKKEEDDPKDDLLGLVPVGRGANVGNILVEREKQLGEKAKHDAYEARKQARADALGISGGALTSAAPVLKQMTDEVYAKLDPKQRAAVDFNTMLADAVEKDKTGQHDYNERLRNDPDNNRKIYDLSVEKMFGKDGGSDLYAPETMAVLRQLKITDKAADLDQYLGMQVAITSDDLKNLTDVQPKTNPLQLQSTALGEPEQKVDIARTLVDKTQALQESLARGNKLMQDFQKSAVLERLTDLQNLGGNQPGPGSMPGVGYQPMKFEQDGTPSDVNTYFQQAFDSLGDKRFKSERDTIWSTIQQDLSPDEVKAFERYVTDRTQTSEFYDQKLGTTKGVKYPTPEHYRDILGLNGEN